MTCGRWGTWGFWCIFCEVFGEIRSIRNHLLKWPNALAGVFQGSLGCARTQRRVGPDPAVGTGLILVLGLDLV